MKPTVPAPYPRFASNCLRLQPLAQREHDLSVKNFPTLASPAPEFKSKPLVDLSRAIKKTKKRQGIVILATGAHVIRAGAACYIIDLMKKGFIDHICFNGACAIHDYEIALIGSTTENVARYIKDGRFGMWKETGAINDIIQKGLKQGFGFGQAIGKAIAESDMKFKDLSISNQAYQLNIPLTVHVGIGFDIIHQHPNFNGSVTGQASHADFLVFAKTLERITGGVYICAGSAVMGPEIFLKALSMVRNAYPGKARTFSTAVFDLVPMSSSETKLQPSKKDHRYYFRPWKTILVRTVSGGGKSFYVQGRHEQTFPALHRLLTR